MCDRPKPVAQKIREYFIINNAKIPRSISTNPRTFTSGKV